MEVIDFGNIISLVVVGLVCYWAGKMSMMKDIIDAVVDEHEAEKAREGANANNGELIIEKHNEIYYAYVGQLFAGQATTFKELVAQIKSNKKINTFTVNKKVVEVLTDDERQSLVDALSEAYGEAQKK